MIYPYESFSINYSSSEYYSNFLNINYFMLIAFIGNIDTFPQNNTESTPPPPTT